jgi:hypothetical protein
MSIVGSPGAALLAASMHGEPASSSNPFSENFGSTLMFPAPANPPSTLLNVIVPAGAISSVGPVFPHITEFRIAAVPCRYTAAA